MESQQWWYNVVSLAMDEQLSRNVYSEYFKEKADHFFGYVYEVSMLKSEWKLYVAGDTKSSKSDQKI